VDNLIQEWAQNRTRLPRGRNAGDFIPTWSVGVDQGHANDIRKYAQDGYGQNSLIYSCIREKATSFAALTAQVIHENGTVVQGHRMTQLLANPNSYQDGQDFAELMETQYEAAGNVYIHMIPQSADPVRRREFAGWPVQELELLRPDYVFIEPGRSRDQDTFVVKVEGVTRARIPRRDIIHVHEPHLLNDFYGLSKIALLTREGAIDLQMSDFELSFFRNAGVPMGLLSVKGKTSPDEIDQIKGRFRKAYNGLRKWFDLLVLNSDQASYTQLGLSQTDMEMDSTRAQVESRICSVFGVPPIIVGARIAFSSGSASAPYEDAEHAFWAETMVPAAMRFARAYQKHLLPRFATTRDRGATVTYDFTQVRALQEDRSRKLREVVRMINTGAFTVNEALTINGMSSIDGGDFYVRTGNQVTVVRTADGGEEIVMQPSPGGANPDNPLEGAARGTVPVLAHTEEEAAVAEALSIFSLPSGGGN